MVSSAGDALDLFARRLASRSVLTREEVSAVLALTGQVKEIAAHIDFVRVGQRVDHSCVVVSGLVGRFGQNSDGVRQITGLYIPGDMADLPSVVSPKSGWGMVALTKTKLLRVPHAELRHIAARHPGGLKHFGATVSQTARSSRNGSSTLGGGVLALASHICFVRWPSGMSNPGKATGARFRCPLPRQV